MLKVIGVPKIRWMDKRYVFWVLSVLFIVAGVLANLHIYFQPASLFNTVVMLVLLVGGIGLIARALSPHRGKSAQ